MHKLFKFRQEIIQTLSLSSTSESSRPITPPPFANKGPAIKSLMYFTDPKLVNNIVLTQANS